MSKWTSKRCPTKFFFLNHFFTSLLILNLAGKHNLAIWRGKNSLNLNEKRDLVIWQETLFCDMAWNAILRFDGKTWFSNFRGKYNFKILIEKTILRENTIILFGGKTRCCDLARKPDVAIWRKTRYAILAETRFCNLPGKHGFTFWRENVILRFG